MMGFGRCGCDRHDQRVDRDGGGGKPQEIGHMRGRKSDKTFVAVTDPATSIDLIHSTDPIFLEQDHRS